MYCYTIRCDVLTETLRSPSDGLKITAGSSNEDGEWSGTGGYSCLTHAVPIENALHLARAWRGRDVRVCVINKGRARVRGGVHKEFGTHSFQKCAEKFLEG